MKKEEIEKQKREAEENLKKTEAELQENNLGLPQAEVQTDPVV